jgi:hypothetical protein
MACEFCFASAAFTVVTIVASGLVGFLSARHISTLNAHRQACAIFRAALAPVCVELRKTNSRPTAGLDSALSETLRDVAIAIEVFAPFVADTKRAAYETAWNEYREAAELGSEFMYKDDRVAEVRRRVEKLLSHA